MRLGGRVGPGRAVLHLGLGGGLRRQLEALGSTTAAVRVFFLQPGEKGRKMQALRILPKPTAFQPQPQVAPRHPSDQRCSTKVCLSIYRLKTEKG